MVSARLSPCLRVLAAVGLGGAWNLGTVGIALSPLMIELWRKSETRGEAFCVTVGYYFGTAVPTLLTVAPAGYGLRSGAELVFYALIGATIVAAAWCMVWNAPCANPSWGTSARICGGLLLTAAPGVGAFGVASPLTAAGLWLPGFGWCGLAVHAVMLSTGRLPLLLAVVGAAVVTGTGGAPAAAATTPEVRAVRTRVDVPLALHDFAGQYQTARRVWSTIPHDSRVVVLPENVGGLWTDAMRDRWLERRRQHHPEQTLVVGATLFYFDSGVEYEEAAAVALLPSGQERVVRQRVPLPGVLWRPWERGGYRAHWFGAGLLDVNDQRLGVQLCYEQLLVFPVLASVAAGADRLVGLSNVRAMRSPGVARWQLDTLRAWASLFGLPWSSASNT